MHLEGNWFLCLIISRNEFQIMTQISFQFAENMEFEKIISIRKFWRYADFVVACFGHRQVRHEIKLCITFYSKCKIKTDSMLNLFK